MARYSYKGKRKPGIELPSLGLIPITVFDNRELSALETIVKYLKENLEFGFSEIASLLNRDERNIWTTYRNSYLKRKQRFVIKQVKFFVPITIFQDRRISVLESLVRYLKEERQCSLHEIAVLLNRDDRTVWTVYDRVQKKKRVIV